MGILRLQTVIRAGYRRRRINTPTLSQAGIYPFLPPLQALE